MTSDLFKEAFKTYKFARDPLAQLNNNNNNNQTDNFKKRRLQIDKLCNEDWTSLGLLPPPEWEVYDLLFPKGLTLIQNPFTASGQEAWLRRTVLDYPQMKDHKNNTKTPSDFYSKLRWVTFGYHHDWDTKVYSPANSCPFPEDLATLTSTLSRVLYSQDFVAEAAIVNYYGLETTMSGHQDRSEGDMDVPLFSISFGQSAIFLIGGSTKEVAPTALHVRSGDVVVMAGESRSSFHGVPRVFKEETTFPYFFQKDQDESSVFLREYVSRSRVNLNVRGGVFPS